MSLADLKKYQELLATNNENFVHAKGIGPENVDGHIAYAKSLGMEFGSEDLSALESELDQAAGEEMNLEELETVAGGHGRRWCGYDHHHRHHGHRRHGHRHGHWRPFGWVV